jgi:uncharacterized protein
VPTIQKAAADFLANKRVAVTGVSRQPKSHGAKVVYRRLRERGYQVFAVNSNAAEVEGDPAYHDLRSIPDGIDAVVIATKPEIAEDTMRECAELGIKHVWMHRSFGAGAGAAAASHGRQNGIGARLSAARDCQSPRVDSRAEGTMRPSRGVLRRRCGPTATLTGARQGP